MGGGELSGGALCWPLPLLGDVFANCLPFMPVSSAGVQGSLTVSLHQSIPRLQSHVPTKLH